MSESLAAWTRKRVSRVVMTWLSRFLHVKESKRFQYEIKDVDKQLQDEITIIHVSLDLFMWKNIIFRQKLLDRW